MAQAASDVFSERTHTALRWIMAVGLGLLYGDWAAVNRRHGHAITGSDLALGLLSALAFLVLCLAVSRLVRHMRRDLHALRAAAWAAFTGTAVGFLYDQTGDASIRRIVATTLPIAAGVFALLFYRYLTRDDATDHPAS
ncbi:hypothetical protein [Streptomyces viridochromogenes]|uniref:Uncharacterized protein n=1 Tax=Streptomyces viridochromogenes Tue57 TaxID=1160705 RepID=L8P271_STRVR|nr:hypothetical protein [Streptomyces viridochromogenes]ELS50259.1 hypothetical protein STVIR_8739 [Streptomyces viridochromogenes Tue57]